MLDFAKLQSSLPNIQGVQVHQLSLEQIAEILNSLEDTQDMLEQMEGEMNEDVDMRGDTQEAMQSAIDEEEKSISKYHPDGTKKTRQELADERWEKRQKWEREFENKFSDAMGKTENSINTLIAEVSKWTSIITSLMNIATYLPYLQELLVQGMALLEGELSDAVNESRAKNAEKNAERQKKIDEQRESFRAFILELKAMIKVISVSIKKLLLNAKMKLAEIEYKMWELVYNSKMNTALAAMQAWMTAVLMVLNIILEVISKLLAMLPSMITVAGEGMSFFLTPKSMQAVHMPIMNLHHSVGSWLSDAVTEAINQVRTVGPYANLAAKGANISKNVLATQAAASITLGDLDIPMPSAEEAIYKAIDFIITLIPIPKPLPKFEQLNIILNPGYLMFLMTGWCRAGQVAFGMPGMFPGIPVMEPEWKEM